MLPDGPSTRAKWVLALYVMGFVEGFVVHLLQVVDAGSHAYAGAPAPHRAFFLALLLVDPVIAVALVRLPRIGVLAAALVMVLDVAANWYANWDAVSADPGRLLVPYGLTPITVFGAVVVATAWPLHRRFVPTSATTDSLT